MSKIGFNDHVAVYGFGAAGRTTAKTLIGAGYKVDAFVDARATQGQVVDGIPAYGLDTNLSRFDHIVIGVFNREVSPRGIANTLGQRGAKSVIGHSELHHWCDAQLRPSFWYDPEVDWSLYQKNYELLREQLCDERSKTILDQTFLYRKSGKISDHPEGQGLEDQYFSPGIDGWLKSKEPISILDCGAFDGDSLRGAMQFNVAIRDYFAFEPDPANYAKLVQTAKTFRSVKTYSIPCGVWHETATIRFEVGSGESARVTSAQSAQSIQAISIDDFLAGRPVDLIKVDVEGADLNVIQGASATIKEHKPMIAIGLYHRPLDLFKIPELIKSFFGGYKFYLRQHGQNSIDLVLYCSIK